MDYAGNRGELSYFLKIYNHPPKCFILCPDRSFVKMPVYFDGTSSWDLEGDIVSYDWRIYGGDTKTTSGFYYTFKEEGVFKVYLTVRDIWGIENSTSVLINISIRNNTGPIHPGDNGTDYPDGEPTPGNNTDTAGDQNHTGDPPPGMSPPEPEKSSLGLKLSSLTVVLNLSLLILIFIAVVVFMVIFKEGRGLPFLDKKRKRR